MKFKSPFATIFLGALLAGLSACGPMAPSVPHTTPTKNLDLPLDLPGSQYTPLIKGLGPTPKDTPEEQALGAILVTGKKNLEWLTAINQGRPADQKLSFSSAATQNAYPIETPTIWNAKTVSDGYKKLTTDLPSAIKNTLLSDQPVSAELPMDQATYLSWGRKIDESYQRAARYFLLKPSRDYLTTRRTDDIRGYYYLSKLPNRDEDFSGFANLTTDAQIQITDALVGMCINTQGYEKKDACTKQVSDAIQQKPSGSLSQIYNQYQEASLATYRSFFDIDPSTARPEITWNDSSPNLLSVPFQTLASAAIAQFLKFNLEDEWRLGDFGLKIDFEPKAAVHLEFVPGTTPHVNAVGGDTITMDANSPLDEYDVQWTIRHEFGHVLAFPDCYIEFYEPAEDLYISYQIDTTDLMCSRRGHIKQRHVDELRKIYFNRPTPTQS